MTPDRPATTDGLLPYRDVIRVGDQFEWAPFGCGFSVRAHCYAEVIDVFKVSDQTWIKSGRITHDGDYLDDAGVSNEEDHFRAMVKLLRLAPSFNELELSRITTASPRSSDAHE